MASLLKGSSEIEDGQRRWGWQDLLALLILLLGVSLFHLRGLWPGQTFLPVDLAGNSLPWRSGPPRPLQNWLISDPLYEFYPFLTYNVNAFRTGHWPLWNPYIFLGHPVAADPLAQPFYPIFSGLGLVLGVARGMAVGLWLHALLAAGLTYGLLRTLRCRRPAALLGAFTYALSGYLVTWFEYPFWTSTLAWLPGILWAFERAVQRRRPFHVALTGLLLGVATLGGQFTFAVTFSLFLGLYALGRTIERIYRKEKGWAWPLGTFVLAVVIGLLLSAVQTLPFAEFLGLSQRVLLRGLLDPFPGRQLITLIVPDFYGNPASIGAYWGEINFNEATIYAGLPALLLAGLAPFSRRRFFASYLGAVTLVLLYFALGGPGVASLGTLPVLQYLSLHRSVFLLPLLVAILAGFTLSRPRMPSWEVAFGAFFLAGTVGLAFYLNWGQAQERWEELQSSVFRAAGWLAAALVLALASHRFPRWRRWVTWAWVMLIFADLFVFGSRFNPAGPARDLMPSTSELECLQAHVGLQRIAVYQLDEQVVVGINALSLYRLAEPGGYSSLVVERLAQLVRAGDPKEEAAGVGRWLKTNPYIIFFNHPSPRLLETLQVDYIVSPFPLTSPEMDGWEEICRGALYIYRRSIPLPRARVVYAAEHIPDDERAIGRLLDEDFPLADVAVTAEPLDLPVLPEVPGHPAEVVDYQDTRVEVAASVSRPGLLILADLFYPGWRAELDGRPVEILRVNHVLRGIALLPGEHRVVFRFAPTSLYTGLGMTLAGLVALAVCFSWEVWACFRRRRPV